MRALRADQFVPGLRKNVAVNEPIELTTAASVAARVDPVSRPSSAYPLPAVAVPR